MWRSLPALQCGVNCARNRDERLGYGRSKSEAESVAVRTRIVWAVFLGAAVFLGSAAAYLRSDAAPACGSDAALGQVYAVLRDRFHLDSVFLNDIKPLAGGYFSDRRNCAAEVTEIRGNVAASGMAWRAVRYRIVRRETAPYADVTVSLGDNVPLAPERRSFWQRLFG
jgi:hypothetical protein